MSYMQGQPQQYAAPQPAPPVEKTAIGLLAGVEPRNAGWMRFVVQQPNLQYPTKLDTKQPEIIQQAMALMGQQVSVQWKEQESTTINPHNGKPYTNRYLNQIAPAGSAPMPVQQQQPQQFQAQAQAQPQQQQQFQPAGGQAAQGREKEMEIMRQTAWKCVSEMAAGGVLDPDPKTLVEAAEVAMAYFVMGPRRFGVTPFDQPQQQQQFVPAQQQPQQQAQPQQQQPQQGGDPANASGKCIGCGGSDTDGHAEGCPYDIPFEQRG
jgi:hypothetical protein